MITTILLIVSIFLAIGSLLLFSLCTVLFRETIKIIRRNIKQQEYYQNEFFLQLQVMIQEERKQNQEKEKLYSENFSAIWKSWNELRRQNNVGLFVQEYDREPTEVELLTGIIQNETN